MDELIEDNVTESGNVSRDGSSSLGVSTDDATTGKTIDWSIEDLSHDVSWDSFLVAFSVNDPVGKVLGLVKLLHPVHLVAVGSIAKVLEEHLVAIRTITELLETSMGIFGDFDFVVMSLENSGFHGGGSFDFESSICGAISCNRSLSHGCSGVVVVDWILEAFVSFDLVHGGEASFSFKVLEIRVR